MDPDCSCFLVSCGDNSVVGGSGAPNQVAYAYAKYQSDESEGKQRNPSHDLMSLWLHEVTFSCSLVASEVLIALLTGDSDLKTQ